MREDLAALSKVYQADRLRTLLRLKRNNVPNGYRRQQTLQMVPAADTNYTPNFFKGQVLRKVTPVPAVNQDRWNTQEEQMELVRNNSEVYMTAASTGKEKKIENRHPPTATATTR
jgi:hypothetical protein